MDPGEGMPIGVRAADKPYPGSKIVAAGDDPGRQIGIVREAATTKTAKTT
jgi:hypothetical protein